MRFQQSFTPRLAALSAFLLASCLLCTIPRAHAIEFDMIFQTKCIFKEVVDDESPVAFYFDAFHKDRANDKVQLNIRVDSPDGDVEFEKNGINSAEHVIEHPQEGEYRLCFTAKDYQTAQNTRIKFNWREGIEAKNWETVAKKENLDTVHTELLRLEEAVHNIHIELQNIRRKEEKMRDVNEATNTRVAWCSIGALITCVGMAGLQLWNLRKFFVRKKLL